MDKVEVGINDAIQVGYNINRANLYFNCTVEIIIGDKVKSVSYRSVANRGARRIISRISMWK